MRTAMKTAQAAFILAVLTGVYSTSATAQDYNHVPGWSNTMNHRYKGGTGKGGTGNKGEWQAKTELFATLRARGPAAQCTLKNLSEADGNAIVNRYRRELRKTNQTAALQRAHEEVEGHHRQLKAQGKC